MKNMIIFILLFSLFQLNAAEGDSPEVPELSNPIDWSDSGLRIDQQNTIQLKTQLRIDLQPPASSASRNSEFTEGICELCDEISRMKEPLNYDQTERFFHIVSDLYYNFNRKDQAITLLNEYSWKYSDLLESEK